MAKFQCTLILFVFLIYRQLSGRVLSEVSAFLYTLFYERNEITIELIPAGKKSNIGFGVTFEIEF